MIGAPATVLTCDSEWSPCESELWSYLGTPAPVIALVGWLADLGDAAVLACEDEGSLAAAVEVTVECSGSVFVTWRVRTMSGALLDSVVAGSIVVAVVVSVGVGTFRNAAVGIVYDYSPALTVCVVDVTVASCVPLWGEVRGCSWWSWPDVVLGL